MSWTLEFDGEEKSLAAWGLSDRVVRRRGNQAPDEVTVMAPGAMEAAAAWSYGDEVIIRRDRSGTPLAGGSIYFRGKVGLPARSGSGTGEGVTHRFVGPWWDFERCVCQQTWKEFAGWSTPGDPNTDPTFTDRVTSELFLGQGVDGARVTTGGVIAEAVAWAATCGVAVQAGVIDPTTEFPIYNCRDMTVAEVIVQMLRWTPDVICWFDYATSPPTFHCRKLANLTAVDVSADGVLSGVELVPKFDLQLPAVCLRFKRTDTVDGRPSVVWTEQNAPEGATGRELGASMHTIELMGSQTNNVYADLECVDATPAQSAVAADRIGWWARKEPLLGSEYLDGVAVSIANVFDDESAAYTLVYEPNELVSGAVADWMTVDESPVVAKKVTVKAGATYDLYRVPVRRNVGVLEVFTGGVWTASNTDKFLVEKGRRKELSANIRITNGTSGTYSALGSYTAGEGVPAGLAADIYEAHSVLQYEGQLVFVGVDVPANLGMGCKINLTVGAVTYANLLVQAVAEDVGAGRMTVSVGPASHLGLGDLVELLRVNRYRLTINNPRTRTTSTVSGDGTVTLGKATARENTTTGLGARSSSSVSDVIGTATAVASVSGGGVSGIEVTYGSYGYASAPSVDISGGGGSGASAHATVSEGVVTGVVVDGAGSGYASAPVVTISAPARSQVVSMDGEAGEIRMDAMGDDGEPAANVGSVMIKLSEALGKEIKLREYEVCVGGVSKLALFLASVPYDPPS